MRWSALAVAFVLWMVLLVPWYAAAGTWAPERHQRGMYWALGAWAVTDLAVLFGWAGA